MVYPCADRSQKTGEGVFAMLDIVRHVADIIEVEHPDTRQTYRNTTPKDMNGQRLCLEIVGSERT